MTKLDIIRAWKDEEYFGSLSETERVSLPQNPAGFVELSDDELRGAQGAALGSCHTCITGNAITCDTTTTSTLSPA
jgi:mersacidin/lichenicidin family type 2 lantibiotic